MEEEEQSIMNTKFPDSLNYKFNLFIRMLKFMAYYWRP